MNPEFLTFHTQALDEATAYMGECITYGGKVYTAVITSIELGNEMIEGGLLENLDTQIVIPKTQLATAPNVGETVLIGATKVRIHKVISDDVSWDLMCHTAKK